MSRTYNFYYHSLYFSSVWLSVSLILYKSGVGSKMPLWRVKVCIFTNIQHYIYYINLYHREYRGIFYPLYIFYTKGDWWRYIYVVSTWTKGEGRKNHKNIYQCILLREIIRRVRVMARNDRTCILYLYIYIVQSETRGNKIKEYRRERCEEIYM